MVFQKSPKLLFLTNFQTKNIQMKTLTREIDKTVSCCNVLLIKAKETIQETKIPTIYF